MLVEHCLQDGVLAGEILVQRTDGHTSHLGDAVGGQPVLAMRGNDLRDRLEDGLDSELGTLLPGAAAWGRCGGRQCGAEQRRVGAHER